MMMRMMASILIPIMRMMASLSLLHKYETTHQICPLCSRKVDPVLSPINLKTIYLEAMFDPKLSPKLSPQTQFPSPF
jgi:hypothetical protein